MIQSLKMKLIAVALPPDGFAKAYEQMEGR